MTHKIVNSMYLQSGNICFSPIVTGSFPVHLSPTYGSLLGGESVVITGPMFLPDDEITCAFGEVEVDGLYIDQARAVCVIPPAVEEFLIEVELRVRRGSAELTGRAIFRYSKSLIDIPNEKQQH